MIDLFLQPFRFLFVLLRHGRFGIRGRDFNEERNATLKIFKDFVPAPRSGMLVSLATTSRTLLEKTQFTRSLIAQAAFLKSRFTIVGGHIRHPALKVSYIRIPKVASTSLSMMMLQSIYPPLENFNLSAEEINYLADANLKKHVSSEDASDLYFTVVRSPFSRIVSVYKQFFNNPDHLPIYDDYLFGILPADLSFLEFVKRIEVIPNALKDQHLKPQYLFLDYYKRKTSNILVLKLENVDQVSDFCAFYDLTLPSMNAAQNGTDYRTFFDYDSLKIVTKMYSQDIKMFGYEHEAASLQQFTADRRGRETS